MQSTDWTYHFIEATTFIMGNKKNAGKTTFMNLALNHIRKRATPALCSVGLDGERNDLIDGRTKPFVLTEEGDLVVTTYPMIRKSEAQLKLLKVFPYHTVLGQLVIAQTVRKGNIELVGPDNNKQLNEVLSYIKNELGCKTIVIDGAANRITPVSSSDDSSFFYVVNADRKNLDKAIDSMKLLSFTSGCKSLDQLKDKETHSIFYVEGALTYNKTLTIPKESNVVVVENFSSVFLTYKQLVQLCKNKKLIVKKISKLMGFVVILKDVEEEELMELYKNNDIQTQLIINPYVA